MIHGQIPKLGLITEISKKDGQTLANMIFRSGPDKEQADKLRDLIFAEAKEKLDRFYKAIDVQAKAVIKQAKADGIIVGRISKKKVTAAGYDTCFHDGVGAYICRNGVRVSEIIVCE